MSFPLRRDVLRLRAAPGLLPGGSPPGPLSPPASLRSLQPWKADAARALVPGLPRSPEGPSGHLVPAFSGSASYLPSANGSASPCFPTPTRIRCPCPHSPHKAPSSGTLSPGHRPGGCHAPVGLLQCFLSDPLIPEPPRAQQLLKSFNANRLRGDASYSTGKGTVRP